jgi:hypothetical protein
MLMLVQSLITSTSVPTLTKILTWTAPAIAIPALRYTQDTRQQRKELFIRDASTYTLGALLFLGTEWLAKQFLDKKKMFQKVEVRNFTAFLVALTANLLYAGIGAVRLSKAFTRSSDQSPTMDASTILTSQHLFPHKQAMPTPVIRMPYLA